MSSETAKYLEEKNFLRPAFPIPLEGKDILLQLKLANVPPEWELVKNFFPSLIESNDQESLLFLYNHGRGAELLTKTAEYFFQQRLLDPNDSRPPFEKLLDVVNPNFCSQLSDIGKIAFAYEFIGRLHIDDEMIQYYQLINENNNVFHHNTEPYHLFINNQFGIGLRGYVVGGFYTIEQEKKMEQWLVRQLDLNESEIRRIDAERQQWFIELTTTDAENIEEPDTYEYYVECIHAYTEENPLLALTYLYKIPVSEQSDYVEPIVTSLLLQGHVYEAKNMIRTVYEAVIQNKHIDRNSMKTYISNLVKPFVDCADVNGIIDCFSYIHKKGLHKLCTDLGINLDQFCSILIYQLHEDEMFMNIFLTEDNIIEMLKPSKKYQERQKNGPLFNCFLATRIYLYGTKGIKHPQKQYWETNSDILTYLAIHYGLDNNLVKFTRTLSKINEAAEKNNKSDNGIKRIYAKILLHPNNVSSVLTSRKNNDLDDPEDFLHT